MTSTGTPGHFANGKNADELTANWSPCCRRKRLVNWLSVSSGRSPVDGFTKKDRPGAVRSKRTAWHFIGRGAR